MSHVYYYVMEGSRYLLADERNKKHLLDLLLAVQESNHWPVYAFCVTDDSAYVITETEEETVLDGALQWVSGRFLQIYEGFRDKRGERYLRPRKPERIQSAPELARRCRAIHRLPLVLGYVGRPGDYWWSSYKTYTQGYIWDAVNCTVLLQYFSSDPEQALRKLKRYHSDPRQGRNGRHRTGAESAPEGISPLRMPEAEAQNGTGRAGGCGPVTELASMNNNVSILKI